ncbi:hypothetical protein ThrDRAFT_03942 [Frankia casuarinae]|uniref:Methyltransferase type 11 n=2 Tax=Frankia casuarinae (strain DSM 45818 / CECT 9043 / HFP020203 / CcI3) TaxID=106370 RepID=Q2J5F9_FRACC|nr:MULTISPECIES: class I SAM-dependent methyltransferase [Frankia]ABD13483.1 Methyltransferase type 11 [Frankia casuarinae]ETA00043.1 hypothetical protein CcI6DRAFT_04542 [Frankia sp. CcI6]EYT90426.1 hypothetical protein ThrDRAFT_03942 [Frankia casuarinae]KDA42195.1 hypothetical protein BMG523Draft_02927 [Frankia sp. BMG5.23]KFB02734.1 methyltransferase family protein [Frankia sp. Allo2]
MNPADGVAVYEDNRAVEMYDVLYRSRKDYAAEARRVAELVRTRTPDARSLLDVACGTGNHLEHFATLFADVAGTDLSKPMLSVAGRRLPGRPLLQADMRSLWVGRTFDAVVCMFSSIGYLRTFEDLAAALRCMASHLSPDGTVVIEPWYFPDTFLDGYVAAHAVSEGNRAITRVSHSTRVGDQTRMELHYLLAGADGVSHIKEIDLLTLFTRGQYEEAFAQADLKAELIAVDGGPGLFVGIRV